MTAGTQPIVKASASASFGNLNPTSCSSSRAVCARGESIPETLIVEDDSGGIGGQLAVDGVLETCSTSVDWVRHGLCTGFGF